MRQERLGYPRARGSRCSRRSARSIEGGGGRVLTDRPAARVARAGGRLRRARRARPARSGAGHDPRAFAAGAGERAYDRVLATVPNDVFEQLLDPALAAEVGEPYLARARGIEYFAALCLLLELDRAFSPYYWTNVADRALPFVGVIEHTNFIEPERYDGRRFLYVANYLPHGHELLGLDADALLARYEAGLRADQPGVRRARWVGARWRFAEPAAQPIVTVGYARADPAAAHARRRPRARQHHAGLSRGPRHELRRAARRAGRGRAAQRTVIVCLMSGWIEQ